MRCLRFAFLFVFFFYSCSENEAPNDPKGDSGPKIEKGLFRKTISVGGVEREYLLYIPESYTGEEDVPLLFSFHGFNSDMDRNYDYTKFNELAEQEKFILVHPQGSLSAAGKHFWNITNLPNVDDLGFVNALIDYVNTNYRLDTSRVYSTGMSNGGFLTFLLGCQLSSKIAAIASVTGLMTASTFDNCAPEGDMPVLQIHGTDDEAVDYANVQNILNYWVGHNSLTNPMTSVAIADTDTSDGSTVEHIVYSSSSSSTRVEHFKVTGGKHDWLGAWGNMDINASAEIWNFLKRYSRD